MVNFALIGIGRWGTNYLFTISKLKNCNLKYIYSPNIQSHLELDEKYIKVNSYNQLVRHRDVDAFIVSSPATTHFKIALDLIKKGHNLIVEKPMVVKYSQALKLLKISKSSKSKIMVGHIYDYNEGFIITKQLIKKIGTILSLEITNYANGPKRNDISVLMDRAYHGVYMCLSLLGKKPLFLYCSEKIKGIYKINFFYENKLKVKIKVSSRYSKKINNMKINGEKGSIVFDDIKKNVILYKNDKIIKEESYYSEPLKMELIYFLKLIKGKSKSNLNEAVETVRVLNIAEKSLKLEKKLSL